MIIIDTDDELEEGEIRRQPAAPVVAAAAAVAASSFSSSPAMPEREDKDAEQPTPVYQGRATLTHAFIYDDQDKKSANPPLSLVCLSHPDGSRIEDVEQTVAWLRKRHRVIRVVQLESAAAAAADSAADSAPAQRVLLTDVSMALVNETSAAHRWKPHFPRESLLMVTIGRGTPPQLTIDVDDLAVFLVFLTYIADSSRPAAKRAFLDTSKLGSALLKWSVAPGFGRSIFVQNVTTPLVVQGREFIRGVVNTLVLGGKEPVSITLEGVSKKKRVRNDDDADADADADVRHQRRRRKNARTDLTGTVTTRWLTIGMANHDSNRATAKIDVLIRVDHIVSASERTAHAIRQACRLEAGALLVAAYADDDYRQIAFPLQNAPTLYQLKRDIVVVDWEALTPEAKASWGEPIGSRPIYTRPSPASLEEASMIAAKEVTSRQAEETLRLAEERRRVMLQRAMTEVVRLSTMRIQQGIVSANQIERDMDALVARTTTSVVAVRDNVELFFVVDMGHSNMAPAHRLEVLIGVHHHSAQTMVMDAVRRYAACVLGAQFFANHTRPANPSLVPYPQETFYMEQSTWSPTPAPLTGVYVRYVPVSAPSSSSSASFKR